MASEGRRSMVSGTPGETVAFNQAVQLHQAGRLAEAERLYRQVPQASTLYPDTLRLLGMIALQGGRPAEAERSLRAALALRADHPVFHANLAVALSIQGKLAEAVDLYRRALELGPDDPDTQANLGRTLLQLGRSAEATAAFATVVAARPGSAAARADLGAALVEAGRVEEAAEQLETAARLDPALPRIHYNLGSTLARLGRSEAALASLRTAAAREPAHAESHFNLGKVLEDLDRPAEAEAAYRAAIAARPDFAEAHNNLAGPLARQMRLDEADAAYRAAIAIRPDYANAHTSRAMVLMTQGRMAEGWEAYEWRFRAADRKMPLPASDKVWTGEAGEGRTLFLHAEQGLGDTLQFCRFAGLAARRGWRVVLGVQPPLVGLVERLEGIEVVVSNADAPPAFDRHLALLSLPRVLGLSLDDIAAGSAPYLSADPDKAETWSRRLGLDPKQVKVGLVWAGGAALGAADRRRSIAFATIEPLLSAAPVQWVSLQKDAAAEPPLIDAIGGAADFDDTAAIVAGLDLVISVDTAVAHLAGAMGKPVWLLNRFDTDWRWLTDRRDSPWYPSMRIYRQPAPGDWKSVLEEVAADLRDAAGTAR